MFDKKIYIQRREKLKSQITSGLILLLGNDESPMNYSANPYPFRQDSTFLYYFGLDEPGLAAVIDVDDDKDILFGYDFDLDDIIWMGPQKTLKEKAEDVGVQQTFTYDKLKESLEKARKEGRIIQYLPPYRQEQVTTIKKLVGFEEENIKTHVAQELIKAIIAQRSIKGPEELEQIELALATTCHMHTRAMKMAKAGLYEREIAGEIEGVALSAGGNLAFPVIMTIHGETLHNHYHGNKLKDGDMLLNDSGAETALRYAADITRTFPVNGKFTQKQKDIYQIVLDAQLKAIQLIKPGIHYRAIHIAAAKVIARGLKDLGLMKGEIDTAVLQGAHALFFPHGLGHMLGLDVHDMENLGEDYVGYDADIKRSDQFGLAYLRLAKQLKSGFVITVEPGIYFIPALIDKWRNENKFTENINYSAIEKYKDFGGIRIEDNVLVTDNGCRVIGQPIPKQINDVEQLCLA
jgi:Xaa-Pro aminopeptidase